MRRGGGVAASEGGLEHKEACEESGFEEEDEPESPVRRSPRVGGEDDEREEERDERRDGKDPDDDRGRRHGEDEAQADEIGSPDARLALDLRVKGKETGPQPR